MGWKGDPLSVFWGGSDFAFVHEEEEVGVADADGVAVLERFGGSMGIPFTKVPLLAVEVDELIVTV